MKNIININNCVIDAEKSNVTADFSINYNNSLFEGHFPNQPILPGVIELAIIEDVLKMSIGKEVEIQHIEEVKFLKSISSKDQNNTYVINVKIDSNDKVTICKSTIFSSDLTLIYMKSTCHFLITNHYE